MPSEFSDHMLTRVSKQQGKAHCPYCKMLLRVNFVLQRLDAISKVAGLEFVHLQSTCFETICAQKCFNMC